MILLMLLAAGNKPDLPLLLGWYVVFIVSVTGHEAAHAWAAWYGGDPTAARGGQLSLDPTPHLRREPMGMVVIPLVSLFVFGWPLGFASAPYDPVWAERHKNRAALMALAGPTANAALLLATAALIHLGMRLDWFVNPDQVSVSQIVVSRPAAGALQSGLARLLSLFFSLNLILLLLNLIPLPPLDGSGALPLLLSERGARRYAGLVRQPQLAMAGMIAVFILFGRIFWPIFLATVNLLYPWARYS